MELTQEYLKTVLHYDPDVGIFTWASRSEHVFKDSRSFKIWTKRYEGAPAGTSRADGYINIAITVGGQRNNYLAHRLAFLYMTGRLPAAQTDHTNHNRQDNRWVNLRSVTHQENGMNQKISSRNTSGFVGVSWMARGNKWRARIKIRGEERHLGTFSSLLSAVMARNDASKKYGFHQNHGK